MLTLYVAYLFCRNLIVEKNFLALHGLENFQNTSFGGRLQIDGLLTSLTIRQIQNVRNVVNKIVKRVWADHNY